MLEDQRIQQWNQWLSEEGSRVLSAEKIFLPPLLTDCYGKHALLLGLPAQMSLLKFCTIPQQILLSPMAEPKTNWRIKSDFDSLPITSASMDLVVIPHTLEYVKNPERVLDEACRVVKPEGYIIIFGFNPYSLWGVCKKPPGIKEFIPASWIKKELLSHQFKLIKRAHLLFRPPLKNQAVYEKLKGLEWIGRKCWPILGGVYMMMAQAKVIPLTPIKVHWKQKLPEPQITVPRPSIRNIP